MVGTNCRSRHFHLFGTTLMLYFNVNDLFPFLFNRHKMVWDIVISVSICPFSCNHFDFHAITWKLLKSSRSDLVDSQIKCWHGAFCFYVFKYYFCVFPWKQSGIEKGAWSVSRKSKTTQDILIFKEKIFPFSMATSWI